MRTRKLAGSLTLAIALACSAGAGTALADAAVLDARPNAALGPDEVVQIVVDALHENAASEDDAGIATVFAFASPGNRAATGPLSRFESMIKGGYSDMLEFRESRFDALERAEDTAMQTVWLMQPDGRETGYVFQLGRQQGGEYDGMWMTDAVYPIGEGPRSGTSI